MDTDFLNMFIMDQDFFKCLSTLSAVFQLHTAYKAYSGGTTWTFIMKPSVFCVVCKSSKFEVDIGTQTTHQLC